MTCCTLTGMEKKILIALFIFFNCVLLTPFVYGSLHTPSGAVFLGTVHYPPDYLYYLSHITQGREHLLFTTFLTTTEPMPNLFISFVYVFLGKIGYMLHISPIYMYQIGLVLFGSLYMYAAYTIIKFFYPTKLTNRILTFLLFMFSNTLPRIVFENGQRILAPYFSWYNYGEPFLRFESIPHHLLIFASIFMMVSCYLHYQREKGLKQKILLVAIAVISAISLGIMNPVQWMLLVGTLGLFSLVKDFRSLSLQTVTKYLPLLVFTIIGAVCVFYLKFVLNREPFTSAYIWEAAQSPTLYWDQILQYYGSVFILALVGMPFFLRSKNESRLLVSWITLAGLLLFFVPFTKKLPVLTFRYLSPLNVLLYAAAATQALDTIPKLFKKLEPLIKSVSFTILFFLLVPLFFIHLGYKLAMPTTDISFYVPQSIYRTFQKAADYSTLDDIFLVYWPYEKVFPTIAGRKEFFTSKFLTVDFDTKNQNAYKFLVSQMTESEKKDFLKKNKITYIIASNQDSLSGNSFLTVLEKSSLVTIYKVSL